MNFKLRPWTFKDVESAYKNAHNINITKNMSDGFPESIEKWKIFIDHASRNKSVLYYAIEINGLAVGGIGVSPLKDIKRKNAELGYWLGEDFWGKGIMTQAVKDIVKQAFEKFDIVRIFATPFETNVASHKVLEKAGFKLEARYAKIVIKNGEMLDELVYAIRK